MIINNINPDLFHIGSFSVRFYGIVYALGFILINHILIKASSKIKNLDKDRATDITMYAMIAGLIGARIFHVVSDFHLYQNNLMGMFQIWNGGLGFQGGFVAAILAVYIYCKKHKIDLFQILDTIAVPLPLIIGFGRIANYINSEHIGKITNLSWCVVFQRVDELCRHPASLYQALSQFLLFGTLLYLAKIKRMDKKSGRLFWSFVAGYGFIRIITDFFRSDYHIFFLGLSHTQLINLAMIVLGIYMIQSSKK